MIVAIIIIVIYLLLMFDYLLGDVRSPTTLGGWWPWLSISLYQSEVRRNVQLRAMMMTS